MQFVKGIGPARALKLAAAGFPTPESLYFNLPVRYEDRRTDIRLEQMAPGAFVAVRARVVAVRVIRTRRRGLTIIEAQLSFNGGILGATFFNQPWLHRWFVPGRELYAYGKLERDQRPNVPSLKFVNPEIELIEEGETEGIHSGRIVPVYRGLGAVAPRRWREILTGLLPQMAQLDDPLAPLAAKLKLPALGGAMQTIHAPPAPPEGTTLRDTIELARRRLAFEELFLLQAGLMRRREIFTEKSGFILPVPQPGVIPFAEALPFTLTGAQKRALAEVNVDLSSGRAMHRMLQGDVGSGKTAVALLAAMRVAQAGGQVAIMAPTELLARQHFRTFQELIGKDFRIGYLSGEQKAAERRQVLRAIASGYYQIVLGTHALFQEKVEFLRLAFAVIDEQHRFGVEQRLLLKGKGYDGLHMLVMSATPIPRSITLTLFGDLDLSIIDEKPPGRGRIVTAVRTPGARGRVDEFLATEMAAGRQVYVVYPVIEESERGLKTVSEGHEELQHRFPGKRIGLLHGRMKDDEKNGVMLEFAEGKIDLLAATTVIEVGIDVANATVMVIEQAEQFGLSQLHQLRGRVGRGGNKSWCILLPGFAVTDEGRERLAIMEKTDDGFKIAEADLHLRGPGELLGTKQSGIPEIRIADLARDLPLLEKARAAAKEFQNGSLKLSPASLTQLKRRLNELWGDRLELAHSG